MDPIALGELAADPEAMFRNPAPQIIGHPDIERSVFAVGQDVNVEKIVHSVSLSQEQRGIAVTGIVVHNPIASSRCSSQ